MTLKQAFTIWAYMPENTALAAKSRTVVQHVLMKKYADIDLEQITERFVRYSFRKCKEVQEVKTKAASILLHILRWGAANGHCQEPAFDISIAHTEGSDRPKISPERMHFLTTGKNLPEHSDEDCKPKISEDMEKNKTHGRAMRPVAQIDINTLQVIKIWPAITTAANELKIQNIDRAIQRRSCAGGFFWCDEKDVSTYKPARRGEITKGASPKKKAVVAVVKPEPSCQTEVKDIIPASVTLPNDEAESRVLESPVKGDAVACGLRDFSDDELIAELISRGFVGTLSITRQVKLG